MAEFLEHAARLRGSSAGRCRSKLAAIFVSLHYPTLGCSWHPELMRPEPLVVAAEGPSPAGYLLGALGVSHLGNSIFCFILDLILELEFTGLALYTIHIVESAGPIQFSFHSDRPSCLYSRWPSDFAPVDSSSVLKGQGLVHFAILHLWILAALQMSLLSVCLTGR